MKKVWSMLAVLALLLVFTVTARAEEKKKVNLKGTITCAKCDLKIEKKCATVIKVKKDDKDVIYYLVFEDKEAGQKAHKAICTEAKEGEVSGTCVKKDGKLTVTVDKIKFND
ncbi:MAG: hypothetical protein HYS12_29235 [Planctomycetes bacterium]|nr:hypothetical protein [Planctomycetota bacterium]